jgi:hypothetical protein
VRWRIAVAVASLALFAGACKGTEKHAAPGPTVPAELPATTTTDPYAVPAVIDTAYVNRVLAGLDLVVGDTLRLYLRDRRISQEISERITDLYGSGGGYDLKVRSLEAERTTTFPATPGNRVTTVSRLITATPLCIYAQVTRDYRPVGGSVGNSVEWVGLKAATALSNPAPYNPTRWVYAVDGVMPDRSEPRNPCATP